MFLELKTNDEYIEFWVNDDSLSSGKWNFLCTESETNGWDLQVWVIYGFSTTTIGILFPVFLLKPSQ